MTDMIDPEYYFDTLVVKVEGRLMKIPKALFAQSVVFRDMFSIPQNADVKADGTDDEHPLVLEGVKLEVFKLFVRVASASEMFNCPLPLITSVELADVYDLGMKWEMSHLCKVIVNSVVTSFNDDYAARKLHLAKRLSHNDWVDSAIDRLLRRPKPLDSDEIATLGPAASGILVAAREIFRTDAMKRCSERANCMEQSWFEDSKMPQYYFSQELKGKMQALKTQFGTSRR